MGCIHHLIKFTPRLAELSEPLRPLLSNYRKTTQNKKNKLDWKEEHTIAFENIKKQIMKITENKHIDITKETRIKSDASEKGLGACLEQKLGHIWKTVDYASRFLNRLEERYSRNELELLAIIWALEHFKYYLHGNKFTLQTDHQALLSALKNNRENKTYQSRLYRWVDRLLPFSFTIEHIPRKNMVFADYLSRHPSGPPVPTNEDDEKFVINIIQEIKDAILKQNITPLGSIKPTGNFNQSESNTENERNDVTHDKLNIRTKESAFCQ